MLNALYSVYVWFVWGLILLLLGPLVVLATALSPHWGFWGLKSISWLAFSLAGIRVKVEGLERVDWSKSYVLMGNHQNMLDPFAYVIALPKHVVGVEKRENLKIPVYGWLSRAWGMIPIDRSNPEAARESIAIAGDRFRDGISVTILPEGTRTKDGRIGPFKKGGFHLALGTGAEIVPFTFNGAYRILKTGSWRVMPGTIEVVFSAPIPTEGYDQESMDVLVSRVRDAICANYKG